jgi:hypothetical protein
MNVLVYEAPSAVAHFVRSVLRARRHRVSISEDAEDAVRKLQTALFDAAVFGPSGAPEALADFIQRELPQMPVVLAGVAAAVPAEGQVAAVLPAPLSAERLLAAFRRLERRRALRLSGLPVQLAGEGVAIACRLADLTAESLVLAGESDEFHRYFGAGPRRVDAWVDGTAVSGDVASVDTDPVRRERRVGVRLEAAGARDLLVKLLR